MVENAAFKKKRNGLLLALPSEGEYSEEEGDTVSWRTMTKKFPLEPI